MRKNYTYFGKKYVYRKLTKYFLYKYKLFDCRILTLTHVAGFSEFFSDNATGIVYRCTGIKLHHLGGILLRYRDAQG